MHKYRFSLRAFLRDECGELELKELGTLLDDIKGGVAKLREAQTKADGEIVEHGKVQSDTKTKLAAIETEISAKDKKYSDALAERDAKIAALETQAARPLSAAAAGGEPVVTEGQKAFSKYLRSGQESLTPEEKAAYQLEVKDLTLSSDTQAGYLAAPPEYSREIIRSVVDFSPVRELATVRSISTTSVQVPRRTAVAVGRWTAENAARTEDTALAFKLEDVTAHENYVYYDMSQALMEDSAFNLEAVLQEEFSLSYAVLEGTAFVNGTGATQPEGIMINADVAATTAASATVLDSTAALDMITLMHAVKAGYRMNATWLMNDTSIGNVRQMRGGDGQFFWVPGTAAGNPNTILGRPYRSATDMPAPTSGLTPILFGDFRRGYWVVDRVGVTMLRDPYTQAASGLVRFHSRRRTGGQVVDPSAFRKLTLN